MLGYRRKEKVIKHQLPVFSLKVYFFVAVAAALLSFVYFSTRKNIILAIMYSAIIFGVFDFLFELAYMLVLQMFVNQYLSFVSSFATAMSVTKSAIQAVKYCREYTRPPLKNILDSVVSEYDAGVIDTGSFFSELAGRINVRIYKQFFMLVKVADETGADIVDICRKVLNNNTDTLKLVRQIKASTIVGFGVIAFMIAINLLIFNAVIQNEEIATWLFTTNRQDLMFNLIAILIGLATPKLLVSWSDSV
ncbi:type II secretion system F family protein [Caldicellulosiruptor morganii]|uniref:Type II secretion system F domain protein n=1 Tax=Caldicellulosiruptor morganii TaxID=1387555 RepID=A0ABY7BKF1_9FIRM|nr:hypothetical protein [Caldicellulosiruptor morganii]WAM33312.1 hypothetical protein OTK00_001807 [Caldicellulosiruptor morganii]